MIREQQAHEKLGIIDLFSGTGGFSLGFEMTGRFRVLGGVELLTSSAATFAANHPNAKIINDDILKISPEIFSGQTGIKEQDVNLVIGGPPCQGFSSIRPFRSLEEDDPRNNLYESFAVYVRHFQPEYFVMENVVGLVTHNNGNTIKQIVASFEEMGYVTDWRVLNAVHYGVPQRRERVVMIGSRISEVIMFPEPTHYFEARSMMARSHEKLILTSPLSEHQLLPAVTVDDAINDLPPLESGESANEYVCSEPRNKFQLLMRENSSTISMHESTRHSAKMLEIIRHSGANIYALPDGMVTSGFSTSYSRLEADEPSVTLTVNFVHPASNKCIHPHQDRALTPREGARLQSFPDTFVFKGNRQQIVKQIGNAVPPLLGKAIAESLLKQWIIT
ncbi:DNA cytosine methyltransferase [Deinococcus enclensis]|uniref:Cytosine-specific methyltransferase n=1 Tax=Deinococcus enclensis TaxID=1049582 RepID=A0ABT9MJ84_9DEIO|nr:DNA cytosine methyltransferase [Deinococcus enclensis]MDP9766632.1 DNA (cytosine-5)-methyltransferase 1 [Deinococcus enclensis]